MDKALSDWGSLVTSEEDPNNLARILVKAQVVSLEEILWFINCSENENFKGETWVAQCEILQVKMLGAEPADEDEPPNDRADVHPNMFDFVGFGQPGQGPLPPPPEDNNAPNA